MAIEVQPGAQTDRLIGVNPWRSRLGVAVRAQAQKGQANEALEAGEELLDRVEDEREGREPVELLHQFPACV